MQIVKEAIFIQESNVFFTSKKNWYSKQVRGDLLTILLNNLCMQFTLNIYV